MVTIKYTNKGFTNSGNEYVTIDNDDMQILMQRLILLLSTYADETSDTNKVKSLIQKNKELLGQKSNGQHNTRLSILGGIVFNYFNKASNFRNDISKSQLPYIENVINEYAEIYDEELIRFAINLF